MELENRENKGVCAVKRILQKYFKKLIGELPSFETSEMKMKEIVHSLANLLEQLESLQQLDTRGMALTSQFPDLLPRLLVRISSETDVKISIITSHIEIIKEHHDLAFKARWDVVALCKKYQSDVTHTALNYGQPSSPPVSVMFSWLDGIERQFREILCSRQFYLENLSDKSVIDSSNFDTLWFEGVSSLNDLLKDCEEQTRLIFLNWCMEKDIIQDYLEAKSKAGQEMSLRKVVK
ncbi:hypothetical protein Btru_058069 [Bulinus truncatus]|nr:hypothetical protein Btru_058069 [Bulinus truncatus]